MNMFLVFSFVSVHRFISFSFQKKHKLPSKRVFTRCVLLLFGINIEYKILLKVLNW